MSQSDLRFIEDVSPQNHPKNWPDWQSQGISTIFKEVMSIFNDIVIPVIFSEKLIFFVFGVGHLNFCMQSYILGMFWDKVLKMHKSCSNTVFRGGGFYGVPLIIYSGDQFWNMLKVLLRSDFIWLRYWCVLFGNTFGNKQKDRQTLLKFNVDVLGTMFFAEVTKPISGGLSLN